MAEKLGKEIALLNSFTLRFALSIRGFSLWVSGRCCCSFICPLEFSFTHRFHSVFFASFVTHTTNFRESNFKQNCTWCRLKQRIGSLSIVVDEECALTSLTIGLKAFCTYVHSLYPLRLLKAFCIRDEKSCVNIVVVFSAYCRVSFSRCCPLARPASMRLSVGPLSEQDEWREHVLSR